MADIFVNQLLCPLCGKLLQTSINKTFHYSCQTKVTSNIIKFNNLNHYHYSQFDNDYEIMAVAFPYKLFITNQKCIISSHKEITTNSPSFSLHTWKTIFECPTFKLEHENKLRNKIKMLLTFL